MINIIDFGAVEGSDISIPLQLAINNASKRKKTLQKQDKWLLVEDYVFIPSGRYILSKPIQLANGIVIRGENQSSVLIECNVEDGEFCFNTNNITEPYSIKVSNIHFISLNLFQGSLFNISMANRSCILSELFIESFDTAIKMTNTFTSVMKDSTIFNCINGLIGENITNGKFYNNKIENCRNYGFAFMDSTSNTSTGLSLIGNIFQGNAKSGVYLKNLDQVMFSACFFEGNNRKSFRIDGSSIDYAHIDITTDEHNHFNKRNGNLLFTSTFITQGSYSPPNTVGVSVQDSINVIFNGGTIRGFSKEAVAFYIGLNNLNIQINGMTMEGIQIDKVITGPGSDIAKIENVVCGFKNMNDPANSTYCIYTRKTK